MYNEPYDRTTVSAEKQLESFLMRRNGILMHISSLPSDYGIGTLGQAAYDFIDYLDNAGQSVWQMLPLNPTGFGDSPYSAYSSFAGNPYFIDLDLLEKDGYLQKDEYQWLDWGDNPEQVDYGKLYNNRFPVLRKAADRFLNQWGEERSKYETFKKEQKDWLDDYALFMALKQANDGKAWLDWKEPYNVYDPKKAKEWARENAAEVEFWKVIQYFFFKQWKDLHEYAKKHEIKLVGDIPFYMAPDSADVWSRGDLFYLDEKGKPAKVAGTPPDNPQNKEDLGQIWGNPVYNWKNHQKDDYKWWTDRVAYMADLFDILRLDHFIGFDSFYAIDADTKDARNGKWIKGPGMELFNAINHKIDEPRREAWRQKKADEKLMKELAEKLSEAEKKAEEPEIELTEEELAKAAEQAAWKAEEEAEKLREEEAAAGLDIIVEDLGHVTPSIRKLLKDTGYPGMKLLCYAFNNRDGEKSPYIPYNYEKNCVAYFGTHDNSPIQGWLDNNKVDDIKFAKEFIHNTSDNKEAVHWDLIRTLLASPAATTIIQAQDLKALGEWARMNKPGQTGPNWAWRIKKDALDQENANWVRGITETYGRLPKKAAKKEN